MPKSVPASIHASAFDCPYCGAYTTQYWNSAHAVSLGERDKRPHVPYADARRRIRERLGKAEESTDSQGRNIHEWLDAIEAGHVRLAANRRDLFSHEAPNLFLSICYHCHKASVWVGERLVFPAEKAGIAPNEDLPDDIVADFDEAREIIHASRGARARCSDYVSRSCADTSVSAGRPSTRTSKGSWRRASIPR
ncbi:MAG TPA: hypothetical protein VHP37_03065 [Burkholderiales bacterium]|nr:hypothetical protein [Burkholderiales bacterium]